MPTLNRKSKNAVSYTITATAANGVLTLLDTILLGSEYSHCWFTVKNNSATNALGNFSISAQAAPDGTLATSSYLGLIAGAVWATPATTFPRHKCSGTVPNTLAAATTCTAYVEINGAPGITFYALGNGAACSITIEITFIK